MAGNISIQLKPDHPYFHENLANTPKPEDKYLRYQALRQRADQQADGSREVLMSGAKRAFCMAYGLSPSFFDEMFTKGLISVTFKEDGVWVEFLDPQLSLEDAQLTMSGLRRMGF